MLYGRSKAAFIGWTMGVNHSTQGAETVNAINNLALLTGNIGRAGASPFSITGQCNAMGTREAGFASGLPGYRKFESAADRAELAALWNIAPQRIPQARGLAYPDIIEAALAKRVRALWIIATNPMVSFPNHDSSNRRSKPSSSWWCRTHFIPRPPARWRTWYCRPPCGAKRKAPTPTPSGASAKSIAR
jgi:assimilatory nitrate reductase catalytic subunit